MTTPQLSLLGFALWTHLVLMSTIGIYRFSRIFTRTAAINEFGHDAAIGPDWYRRSMRAHANCVENLPVYAAIVAVLSFIGASGSVIDTLAVLVLATRVGQSLVHIAFVQTARAVWVRFSLFFVQLVGMLVMGISAIAA